MLQSVELSIRALQEHAFKFLIAALSLSPCAAAAATIEVHKRDKGPALIVLRGEMVAGDVDTFRTKTSGIQHAVVAMHSPGGQLFAGIEIGKIIRFKNYATIVPDGARCASACAVAWLGGTRRFIDRSGKIGFHAAYVVKSGRAKETGAGNAVLGSYLGQLGLPEEAIIYITMAGPKSMTWLDVTEAQQLGIQVAHVGMSRSKAATSGSAPSDAQPAKPPAAEPQPAPKRADGQDADKLTPQQARMKECGTRWQAHKKEHNVQGQAEYRKFLSTCLKG